MVELLSPYCQGVGVGAGAQGKRAICARDPSRSYYLLLMPYH